jgi:hypothetical protein
MARKIEIAYWSLADKWLVTIITDDAEWCFGMYESREQAQEDVALRLGN